MEAKRIFQEGRKSQMYEILLRRNILEKLVTAWKGGKVDVLVKAKWKGIQSSRDRICLCSEERQRMKEKMARKVYNYKGEASFLPVVKRFC